MAYSRNPTWQDGEGLTLISAVRLNTIEDGLVAASAQADSALSLANTKADATRQILAGTGLSGGGSLTIDRTLAVVYGTTAGTAAQGNDSRLSDARTPLAHTQAASTISDSTAVGRSVLTAADAAAARTAIGAGTSSLALGTTGTTAAAGNDARFGSPAGWVPATVIADGTDLDTLTNAGMYVRTSATGTTTALHYPSNSAAGYLEVIYGGSSSYVLQRWTALSMVPGTTGLDRATYVRVKFGATWTAWQRVQIQGDIGSGDAIGTGSPEGVVSAPVGSYYTDTASTNGATRWYKFTGTGNTGWGVVVGDTGLRQVTSLLINGWANQGGVSWGTFLQRVGNLVRFAGYFNAAAATAIQMITIPVGFRVAAGRNAYGVMASNAADYRTSAVLVYGATGVIEVPYRSAMAVGFIDMTWTTNEAWPTSLPGSAG